MVGIIYIGQVELAPFCEKYVSVLEEEGEEYEIVHWNRSGIKCPNDDVNHTLSLQLDRYTALWNKAKPFFIFRKFAKGIIKEKKYDKLIILTTQTAVMLPELLLGKYKKKYFFDYRDTSYEYIKPYRAFVNRIILNSAATSISSKGFCVYLTRGAELIAAHNFRYDCYEKRVLTAKKSTNGIIKMGYIGYLREYEYLKVFVDMFGRDERYEFHIHGSGDCEEDLRRYAEKYKNVTVYGAYEEKDKSDIVDTFDMILYNYPKSFVNYPAVANKFYDGIMRKKPMLGNINTYSGKLVEMHGLGISLPEGSDDIADMTYKYYKYFDEVKFARNCEEYLSDIIREDKYYVEKIREFVRG